MWEGRKVSSRRRQSQREDPMTRSCPPPSAPPPDSLSEWPGALQTPPPRRHPSAGTTQGHSLATLALQNEECELTFTLKKKKSSGNKRLAEKKRAKLRPQDRDPREPRNSEIPVTTLRGRCQGHPGYRGENTVWVENCGDLEMWEFHAAP